jgi:RNA polymerase sigma-70 factor (ECF subfamily)
VQPNEAEPAIHAAFERARTLFSGVEVDYGAFDAHVRSVACAGADGTLAEHAHDLYLAIACAAGNRAALDHFEGRHLADLARHRTVAQLSEPDRQELRQRIRSLLFTGAQPAILGYAARAPLDAWVRVIAIREALRLHRELRLAPGAGPEQANSKGDAVDSHTPELQLLLANDGPVVENALTQALEALGARERTLLRLHLLDGLSIDEIGRLYRVHRATAARWLVAIRTKVYSELREVLPIPQARGTSAMRSLVLGLRDQVSVSLSRILR